MAPVVGLANRFAAQVFEEAHYDPKLQGDTRRGDLEAGLVMNVYDVYVPSFRDEWCFAAVCKSGLCGQRWQANAARVNLELRRRLLKVRGTPTDKNTEIASK